MRLICMAPSMGALCSSKVGSRSSFGPPSMKHLQKIFPLSILLSLLSLPSATPLNFSYADFKYVTNCIKGSVCLQGDATVNRNGYIQLTANSIGENLTRSVGRAVFEPVLLRKNSTVADFTTDFNFEIRTVNKSSPDMGDGLAFFLSPYPSQIPDDSSGRTLGLVSDDTSDWEQFQASGAKSFVAVEFDTYRNAFDPGLFDQQHVGIDINSMRSTTYNILKKKFGDGPASARISYNSSSRNLSVYLDYNYIYKFSDGPILSQILDLSVILPENVSIGLSATTGASIELHSIYSWSFMSEDLDVPLPSMNVTNGTNIPANTAEETNHQDRGNRAGLMVGISIGAALFLFVVVGLTCFIYQHKRNKQKLREGGAVVVVVGVGGGHDVEHEEHASAEEFAEIRGKIGPKKFTYKELAAATENFNEERKLGQGGSGHVYRGFLKDINSEAAIKRLIKGPMEAKKEYIAEVKIISSLRHRNLVQLVGWCHDHNEFLLVYEFMPNGSLDFHLFCSETPLSWSMRYKITQGLASALFYLHGEWDECVIHRDVKPNNIMLDADFNAKLGDFGLARTSKHGGGLETSMLGGTMGYMAPEYINTGKASKESDIYSFGVVALEVACGRRSIETSAEEGKVKLVDWAWRMYGAGRLTEVGDSKLNGKYDQQQMERLLVLGLWCAHPDKDRRPTIMQVINILNLAETLPTLPSRIPTAS